MKAKTLALLGRLLRALDIFARWSTPVIVGALVLATWKGGGPLATLLLVLSFAGVALVAWRLARKGDG